MLTKTVSRRPTLERDLGLQQLIPSLYQVGVAAILGAVLLVALAPRLDTDFWWHLKDGQYIALHHIVPTHDFMSFTLAGHVWTDHEWLAELMTYGLYRLAGLWGPIAFFAIVICATFALVYIRTRLYSVHPLTVLFLITAAFVASSASWGPRMQMLTLFFLAAYSLFLEQFGRTGDRRLLILFPLLMLFWANMHGGFVLGLVLLLITLVGEWLNRIARHEDAWTAIDLKMLTLALAATAGVTMVNPNGVRQLLYPLTFVLPNAYTNLIFESASPNFHLPVIMVFEILLVLMIGAFFLARTKINWTHLFLTVAFTHLALSQVRNVAIWAVVITPLVAFYLSAAAPALREQFPALGYKRRPVQGRIGPLLNAVLIVLVAATYAVVGTQYVNARALTHVEAHNFPRTEVAYMRTHPLPKRVFASYSWGGYLLWNLFPRYRDYMDSRADTLFDTRILDAYLTMHDARPGWRAQLARYEIQDVLVERDAPLAQILALDPHWRLVSHDAVGVLYVRRPGQKP